MYVLMGYLVQQIDFSSILQCTGTIKHRLAFPLSYSVQGLYNTDGLFLYLTVYRDYNTQIGFSSILQCTGTIQHRLAFPLSYSVQGL